MKSLLLIVITIVLTTVGLTSPASAAIMMSVSPNTDCTDGGCDAFTVTITSDQGAVSSLSFSAIGNLQDLDFEIVIPPYVYDTDTIWNEGPFGICAQIYPPPPGCGDGHPCDSHMLFKPSVEPLIFNPGSLSDTESLLSATLSGFTPFTTRDIANVVVPDGGFAALDVTVVINGESFSSLLGEVGFESQYPKVGLYIPEPATLAILSLTSLFAIRRR